MKFRFSAKIFKVGINPCVMVPPEITARMTPVKGYIPVKGKIERHPFRQTLVPVRSKGFRLFVNGPMLKGATVKTGDVTHFVIEQDFERKKRTARMNPAFRKALTSNRLLNVYTGLIPSRKKDILKYLNSLKTQEALLRNIDRVISQLRAGSVKKKYP
ncbi:MAG TPA: DUF1905 domain-containing protein [Chryseosolibacter sp.]|nr:DUF1905 domain-containing protein [Chryseosolibacter sp.]